MENTNAQSTVSSQSHNKQPYKILVVDDEESIRTQFQELLSELSNENWEVSVAVDGNDAVAKAEATKFDLIYLDIVMPNKDGIQTLSELTSDKSRFGSPRVIMLTNIGGDVAVEEALKLGAVSYKLKLDVSPEELLALTKEELAKITKS